MAAAPPSRSAAASATLASPAETPATPADPKGKPDYAEEAPTWRGPHLTEPPPIITRYIDQILKENVLMAKAIAENQNLGRLDNCVA